MGDRQSQGIAYSTDKGRTWTAYGRNPVIPTPNNIRDFRDPKVFWVVFSELIFPREERQGLEFFVKGGDAILNFLEVYELKPALFFISPRQTHKTRA